jgi:hypothetical protein
METAVTDEVTQAQFRSDGEEGYLPLPAGVLKAVRRPASIDIPQVLSRMQEIQVALGEAPSTLGPDAAHKVHEMSDGLGCFNYLYQVITQQILDELTTGTFFHDPEFLQELDLQFAHRYFDAIDRYGNGRDYPRSWAVLLDRRSDEDITPMQFAVAGVNTHVNFDLPCAVVATCRKLGRRLHVPEQRHDYDRVNEVFFDKIPALRQHFDNGWERWLDQHVFRWINNLVDDAIVVLDRNLAWLRAEDLWEIPQGAALRSAELDLDRKASEMNELLLSPVPSWLRGGAAAS